jgi:hypothetical protein
MYWLKMPDGKVWFSWLLLALLQYKHADEINKRDVLIRALAEERNRLAAENRELWQHVDL